MNYQSMSLKQVKLDFENTKKRVFVAQTMKAQGFSEKEILAKLEEMKAPDMADLVLQELLAE